MQQEKNCTKIEDDVKDCKGVVYLDETDEDEDEGVLKCCKVNDEDDDDGSNCVLIQKKENDIRWAFF